MAEPKNFEHVNGRWYGKGDVGALPVCDTEGVKISKWELSEEEAAEVASTGVVWLYVWADQHPAVYVAGGHPFGEATTAIEQLECGHEWGADNRCVKCRTLNYETVI